MLFWMVYIGKRETLHQFYRYLMNCNGPLVVVPAPPLIIRQSLISLFTHVQTNLTKIGDYLNEDSSTNNNNNNNKQLANQLRELVEEEEEERDPPEEETSLIGSSAQINLVLVS